MLVAYGNQNVMVSGQPQFTNFYTVFRRYTHFSQETIAIPLDGINELSLDYPVRLRAKLPRNADLITDLHLVFQVPPIYSKIWELDPSNNRVPAFRWIHMLGPLLIDNAAVFVGGSKIQEFPGEWMVARATADYTADEYLKWRSMVGDVPELHSPEWGIHGKATDYPFQRGEYPHTAVDVSGGVSAPSLPARTIRVPLPLWFSESWGRALPLLCLQLHEVEVQLILRPLREIYRIMDQTTQAEPVQIGRRLVLDPTKPTDVDPTVPVPPYTNLTLQDNYESYLENEARPRYFYNAAPVGVGSTAGIPALDGFNLNARLEANYVYLTDRERITFAEREIQTLVHQVQLFRFPSVVTRTKLDLDAHGLVSRILFYARRSDAIDSRNDFINCSNWKNLTQAPYWPLAPGSSVPNSGLAVPYSQRDILRSARLVLDGNDAFDERPADWYELEKPFHNTAGQGITGLHPGALKPDNVMGPLYQIPFALNGSDHEQPSGTMNASRVHSLQLEVNPWPLDPMSNYAYDFTVFVESLNTIKYINGMAGLAFAI